MPESATEEMYSSQEIFIPPSFPYLLRQFAKSAIRSQPPDLLKWSTAYFKCLSLNIPPPVKPRLEYPIPSNYNGITPGWLKTLMNQLPDTRYISFKVLWDRWIGACLQHDTLIQILCLGEFDDPCAIPWLRFISLCAAYLTENLTQSMILICEILTEEPEGGSARVPLDTFLDLYKFLARIDGSQPKTVKNLYFTDSLPNLWREKVAILEKLEERLEIEEKSCQNYDEKQEKPVNDDVYLVNEENVMPQNLEKISRVSKVESEDAEHETNTKSYDESEDSKKNSDSMIPTNEDKVDETTLYDSKDNNEEDISKKMSSCDSENSENTGTVTSSENEKEIKEEQEVAKTLEETSSNSKENSESGVFAKSNESRNSNDIIIDNEEKEEVKDRKVETSKDSTLNENEREDSTKDNMIDTSELFESRNLEDSYQDTENDKKIEGDPKENKIEDISCDKNEDKENASVEKNVSQILDDQDSVKEDKIEVDKHTEIEAVPNYSKSEDQTTDLPEETTINKDEVSVSSAPPEDEEANSTNSGAKSPEELIPNGNDKENGEIETNLTEGTSTNNEENYVPTSYNISKQESLEHEEIELEENKSTEQNFEEVFIDIVPGIGSVVPEELVMAVCDYMEHMSLEQNGMVMPRNVRHYDCPPLEIV